MATVAEIRELLQNLAPTGLAESWDNVGLLVGNPDHPVQRGLTCLTLTQDVAEEGLREDVQLIVTHHPLPFRPLNRITTEHVYGRVIWRLIRGGISVYSPHTAFDSAAEGINAQLASLLELTHVTPLVKRELDSVGVSNGGSGRRGALPTEMKVGRFVEQLKLQLGVRSVQLAGSNEVVVRQVAVACGSGGSFWEEAARAGCQVLVTGDIGFHQAIEAAASGVAVVAIGHYASERFALEWLAQRLTESFPDCTWWPSRSERDPFQLL